MEILYLLNKIRPLAILSTKCQHDNITSPIRRPDALSICEVYIYVNATETKSGELV